MYKLCCTPAKQPASRIIYKPSLLTPQVPCWLRPRDRTRSPEVLNNVSRPTTLPLRIPPRISITQADTDRFTHNLTRLNQSPCKEALRLVSFLSPLIIKLCASLPQLRSRKWRVTRSHPAGLAESRPHPAHLLSPGPEKRVLPLPFGLGLRHVAQDGLAQLLPRKRRVRLVYRDKKNEGERACTVCFQEKYCHRC